MRGRQRVEGSCADGGCLNQGRVETQLQGYRIFIRYDETPITLRAEQSHVSCGPISADGDHEVRDSRILKRIVYARDSQADRSPLAAGCCLEVQPSQSQCGRRLLAPQVVIDEVQCVEQVFGDAILVDSVTGSDQELSRVGVDVNEASLKRPRGGTAARRSRVLRSLPGRMASQVRTVTFLAKSPSRCCPTRGSSVSTVSSHPSPCPLPTNGRNHRAHRSSRSSPVSSATVSGRALLHHSRPNTAATIERLPIGASGSTQASRGSVERPPNAAAHFVHGREPSRAVDHRVLLPLVLASC